MDQDLLGHPLTDVEKDVARIYAELKALASHPEATPCVARNARKALACLWQTANDLDLVYEQLYDQGV